MYVELCDDEIPVYVRMGICPKIQKTTLMFHWFNFIDSWTILKFNLMFGGISVEIQLAKKKESFRKPGESWKLELELAKVQQHAF